MHKRGWFIIVVLLLYVNSAIADEVIRENETKIFRINGKETELSVITISEIQKEVLFKTGNRYFKLRQSEHYDTGEITVILRDILASGKSTQKSIARIIIGGSYLPAEYEERATGEYQISGTITNVNPYFYNIAFEEELEDLAEKLRKNAEEKTKIEAIAKEKPIPEQTYEEELEEQKPSAEPAKITAEIELSKIELNYTYITIIVFISAIIIGIILLRKMGVKHIKPKITIKKKKSKKNRVK